MKNRTLVSLIFKSISFVVVAFAVTVTGAYAQPANDNFGNAQVLSGIRITVAGNNVEATKETGEPQHAQNPGGKSVWFKWTAPMSRVMSISTSRTSSNLNTLLGVYIGSAVNSLSVQALGDDISFPANVKSRALLTATGGETYYIAVDGSSVDGAPSVSGSFQLDISPAFPVQALDQDGDGITDLTVYRPSTGDWYTRGSTKNIIRHFGADGDMPVAIPLAFRNGESTVFRPSTGTWYSQLGCCTAQSVLWGTAGDIPTAEAFSGGINMNYTVFRPSTGMWYAYVRPEDNLPHITLKFGLAGDIPVPGNYSPDRFADIAVYRPSTGVWYIFERSSFNVPDHIRIVAFGIPGDKPVQGDYDGDGLLDPAIYRPSTGTWWVLRSSDNQQHAFQFGSEEDIPATGDYDGDGIFDFAVFRPSTGNWYVRNSGSGTVRIEHWGATGDLPVTANTNAPAVPN
ncbi:MAG: hypothetical protein DMF63_09000 [Acidobacteria bacterium]|nr:MAG: hypothetical protein DMF63_09000 [Acidobacteriota bacterium]